MSIFSRLNSVIKSNLNALIDRAEDPEKLIAQTVVDMEAEVRKARRELVSTLGTSKRLDKQRVEHEEEAKSWEAKAVLALQSGDEELAREALRRKTRATWAAEDARRQSDQQDRAAAEMKDTLERVEAKIKDLKNRKGTLASQVRRARENTASPSGGSRFGSGTFDELDRMTGRIDQLEAEVEAANVLEDPKRLELEARFRALEKGDRADVVDDELAALKKKLGG